MRRLLRLCAAASVILPASLASAHDGPHAVKPVKNDDRATAHHLPGAKNDGQRSRVVVWLNGGGATLTGGWDDAARGVSSVVYNQGLGEVTIPRFGQSKQIWRETVDCIKAEYAPFDIDIVEERPKSGAFIEAVIGGESSVLGYGAAVGGIAPYDGSVQSGAVVFAFEQTLYQGDAQPVCEVATHEIGHALGLDHIYLCQDPMTYLQGCGHKTFQDEDAPCGEDTERACATGAKTQNSYRQLADALGLRGGGATRPTNEQPTNEQPTGEQPENEQPPTDEQPTDEQPTDEPQPSDDGDAPAVSILTPESGSAYDANSLLRIDIQASSDDGIARVELAWASDSRETQVYACDAIPDGAPVTCAVSGDVYTFVLRVGAGARAFQVRATDGEGRQSISEVRELSFVAPAADRATRHHRTDRSRSRR